MMRRAALILCAVLLAFAATAGAAWSQHGAGPAPAAGGAGLAVSIGFDAVKPMHLDVLTGETVTWTNDSVRPHTVTADDGSFDSGRLPPTTMFARQFTTAAEVPYHCSLHPFIRGVVSAHPLLLTAPTQAASSNRPFPLSGRAALTPGAPVTIQADRGAGFQPVATTTLQPDGTFVAQVVPGTTATYRAVAGAGASPPVNLLVLDRSIAVRAQRGRKRVVIRTKVAPASAGAPVVLQLFLHDHFGWWPVQRGRLDHDSTATFSVRLGQRVAARLVLTLPDGATPLAVSRTVRLGPTR
jgi:plastocyanin